MPCTCGVICIYLLNIKLFFYESDPFVYYIPVYPGRIFGMSFRKDGPKAYSKRGIDG
jgi:hypothetical protein